ncbi:MAG: CbrC family protein [Bacteroides sp.]|nr:CbrC family protein [Bacteroides sp.]
MNINKWHMCNFANIPTFKYCSSPIKAGLLEPIDSPEVCECCGESTNVIYPGPFYSAKEISILCPKCIASGKAAELFSGEFVDFESINPDIEEEFKEELCLRTPSYNGIQQESWPDHCNDFCEFIAYVGWEEIKEMGIEDSVEFDSDSEEYADCCEDIVNNSNCQGYLFRCLKCGQYILHVDCD